jgi:hypothetical protein
MIKSVQRTSKCKQQSHTDAKQHWSYASVIPSISIISSSGFEGGPSLKQLLLLLVLLLLPYLVCSNECSGCNT